jgi:ketosteroid isomerase-like protein
MSSNTTGSAQQIADEYVRAWIAGDVEKALSLVADDVVCQAPTGLVEGLAAYRQFLEPFATALLGGKVINVLGDDTHAAAVYSLETPFAKDFRGMEYLTVRNGKITNAITVFDRAPLIQAGALPQHD